MCTHADPLCVCVYGYRYVCVCVCVHSKLTLLLASAWSCVLAWPNYRIGKQFQALVKRSALMACKQHTHAHHHTSVRVCVCAISASSATFTITHSPYDECMRVCVCCQRLQFGLSTIALHIPIAVANSPTPCFPLLLSSLSEEFSIALQFSTTRHRPLSFPLFLPIPFPLSELNLPFWAKRK